MNRHFNMLYEFNPFPYLCGKKLIWKNFHLKLPLLRGYNTGEF